MDMFISFSLNDLLLFQIALFSVFSPFAVIGPFTALTGELSRRTQKRIALRVSLLTGINLILINLVGNVILGVLGISVEALSAAGGLVLIISSLNMVLKGDSPRRKVKPDDISEEEEGWEAMVVTPLLFPITMGAGTISLVLTQAGHAATTLDKLVLCGVIVIHSFIVLLVYFFAGSLSERIGNKGNAVLTRVGGIILLSLAFIIFTRGLKVLLPGLA